MNYVRIRCTIATLQTSPNEVILCTFGGRSTDFNNDKPIPQFTK